MLVNKIDGEVSFVSVDTPEFLTLELAFNTANVHLEVWDIGNGKFAFVNEENELLGILDHIPENIHFNEDNHWEKNWGGEWRFREGEYTAGGEFPGSTPEEAAMVSEIIGREVTA